MATVRLLPIQAQTLWIGCDSASSVSRVERRFCQSLGHDFRPARRMIFYIWVRRFVPASQ
jgi:hypothetical protein